MMPDCCVMICVVFVVVGVSENEQVLAMMPDCCACGVGKYEMTFEGIWSRQTHPKDFPFRMYPRGVYLQ